MRKLAVQQTDAMLAMRNETVNVNNFRYATQSVFTINKRSIHCGGSDLFKCANSQFSNGLVEISRKGQVVPLIVIRGVAEPRMEKVEALLIILKSFASKVHQHFDTTLVVSGTRI